MWQTYVPKTKRPKKLDSSHLDIMLQVARIELEGDVDNGYFIPERDEILLVDALVDAKYLTGKILYDIMYSDDDNVSQVYLILNTTKKGRKFIELNRPGKDINAKHKDK